MTSSAKAEAINQTSYGMTTILIQAGGDVKKLNKEDRDYWVEKLNILWDTAYEAGKENIKKMAAETYPEYKVESDDLIKLQAIGQGKYGVNGKFVPYRTADQILDKAIWLTEAETIKEYYKDFQNGILKVQERMKQRVAAGPPTNKKYDTWASGIEDVVMELEWLWEWMKEEKKKYLKTPKAAPKGGTAELFE